MMLQHCFESAMVSLMVIMERSRHSQTALFLIAFTEKDQK